VIYQATVEKLKHKKIFSYKSSCLAKKPCQESFTAGRQKRELGLIRA
jgi:hypothetical protein